MSDIDHKAKGSILAPLKNLSFFGRPALTVPLDPRPASKLYRGFRLNDWETCVGCSTCQKVCDNAAIAVVKVPGAAGGTGPGHPQPAPGHPLRPLLLVRPVRGPVGGMVVEATGQATDV
jgi:NAD-dependent dihydropyrimidine dehydrogenase PreA subunit